MHRTGQGVPQDYKTAEKWWKLAAKQGNAQSSLGVMYNNGHGVPKDYKTALKWTRLAARQGNAFAQSKMGPLVNRLNAEKNRGERERLRKTCSGFGFKDGSKEMSTCMFDLYKLEKSKSQTRTVIQNNTDDGSAVRALLEEQKKQRQLEGSLELMRRGFEMMSPPKPKLTCKYNTFTKTTICN